MNIFNRITQKIPNKNLKLISAILGGILLLSVLGIYLYKTGVLKSKDVSISSKEQARQNLQKISKIVSEKMKYALLQIQPDIVYKKYNSNQILDPDITGLKNRSKGAKNPKHKMLVFIDFSCSICNRVSTELKQRLEENKDRLEISYVLFPLDKKCNANLKGKYSDYSCFSAELALCAEKEGRFFESFGYLYNNRPSKTAIIDRDVFIAEMSKKLKLKNLKDCMISTWLKKRMAFENKIYKDIKIPGAPYVVLDGKHLGKVYRFKESFSDFLDYKELKEK